MKVIRQFPVVDVSLRVTSSSNRSNSGSEAARQCKADNDDHNATADESESEGDKPAAASALDGVEFVHTCKPGEQFSLAISIRLVSNSNPQADIHAPKWPKPRKAGTRMCACIRMFICASST